MGELQHALARRAGTPAGAYGHRLRGFGWFVLVAALATACAPVVPTASTGPALTGSKPPSSVVGAIDPSVGRLVWLVDQAGGLGVWTTDLAGGDVRPYQADLDVDGASLRDARLVGDDVVLIRESPAVPTPALWVVSRTTPMRLLLDAVESFVVSGDEEVLAVRDEGTTRSVWRVATDGVAPALIAEVPLPGDGPELGPFGFAISPDGRTVAAGWVGGPVHVVGSVRATFSDLGAPLVVADDGRIVAVTGRAGEAYLVDGGRLVDLAPPDSDPVALPGSGVVAWPTLGQDGLLATVEVRDLLAGMSASDPANGPATNVRELTAGYVILEATAFDPLSRTVGILDRSTGRFGTFEAAAPED
jgi:hypothetical protein